MSNASKPDGTDPRILQPEGRDVITPNTNGANAHQRYHKPGCRRIETMDKEPKTVDVAVAKWKDLKPCQTCHTPRMNDHHDGLAIEGPQVDRWRRALVWGGCSCSDVAAALSVHRTSVRRHVSGDMTTQYETPPRTPPITFARSDGYEWRWDE